jgi:hypothetical protein
MEYFVGSIVTLIAVSLVIRALKVGESEIKAIPPIRYSQSYIYAMVAPYIRREPSFLDRKESQATKILEDMYIRTVFLDDKAYWIYENKFFMADSKDGEILHDTRREVDTMSMDKVQLNKMIYIIEKLTEGKKNDSGNSGESQL